MKTVFPNGFNVYKKDLVINYIQERHLGISLNLNVPDLTIEKYNSYNSIKNNHSNNVIISINKNEIKNEKENSTLPKSKTKQNDVNIIKHMIDMENSIKNLYKSAPRSRFNFVKQDKENNEYSQIIQSQLNDFITQLFVKHSIFLHKSKII
jgi:hypothetical protein